MSADETYPEGATVIDCGDEGTIEEVHHDHDQVVYEVEFDDGGQLELTDQEMELGLADGTIKVIV